MTEQSTLQLAGAYGLHILLTAGELTLANAAFTQMGINSETVDNPELAILTVQYLTMEGSSQSMDEALALTTRMIGTCASSVTTAPRVRKRIVELLLEACYRIHNYECAVGIISTFLLGNPFKAEGPDLQPLLNVPDLLRGVISWLITQEIYFKPDAPGVVGPPDDLRLIPYDLQEVRQAIISRLPMKGKLPANTVLTLQDTRFVIDGANILFSGGESLLRRIINQLKPMGSVVIVLHKRHVVNLSGFSDVTFIRTPYGVNDDYYSLSLAMDPGTGVSSYLVTNDQFRDHVYEISPLIKTWRQSFVITFSLDGTLTLPLPYSHCIQSSADGARFYIPTTDPYKWIVI